MKHVSPLSASPVQHERSRSIWRQVLTALLLVLVGYNIRAVVLAVPPVLPLIQHDLALTYALAGLLTALPVLMLGSVAWLSGLLVERIGPRTCVTLGLVLLAAGTLLRAFWPNTLALFLFTVVLSLGIVMAQTAAPVLTRLWFPAQIGMVAALFTDGLIIGESAGAGLTVPFMQRFLGPDNWAGTFIFWGVPIVLLLLLWLWLAPAAPALHRRAAEQTETPLEEVGGEKRPRVNSLHLGVMLGAGSLIYFGMNGWIASYNLALHRESWTPLALVVLNAAQLPASLALTFVAQRLAGSRWPFIGAGIVCGLSILGWFATPAPFEVLWAALLGASSALVFTLGIALPPLLARPGEVGRLTGITVSLTYAVAFVGPFLGGALWDLFALPLVAFVPVIGASLILIVLGALLPARSAFGL